MEELKVLITTSGIGSRLGDLTEYTNKSLVRVGSVAAISRIVDSYPSETHFVVTLGHYGNHVKQYLEMLHHENTFTFVEVDKYQGPGSSLLYSISKAKDVLQCPFIFHACDTISSGHPHDVACNWVTAYKVNSADQYRTIKFGSDMKFAGFNDKGEISFDYAYPGICGIKDFMSFWEALERILEDDKRMSLSDCDVINSMLPNCSFDIVELDSWYDIGNASELEKTRAFYQERFDILDKPQENIYFYKESVIKFFHDSELVQKRVKRSMQLSGLVPPVTSYSENLFKYNFTEGNLFSKTVNPQKMRAFLQWSSKNMWDLKSEKSISQLCKKFYIDKTLSRVNMFLGKREDTHIQINGESIPPVDEMLSSIDEQWLCNGKASKIHGDLILDNVIETPTGFTLIDWRQDFAGDLQVGDLYYDLAKLNHNLVFNHELVNAGRYDISESNSNISCDILCSKNLIDCREVLRDFISSNGLDMSKVDVLTGIVWINMAPLHEHPLDKFLFNFGKYNLYSSLKKRGSLC